MLNAVALDVPVCVAQIGMLMFGADAHENEEFEHQWSIICKQMAKYVVVRPDQKFVYIGDNSDAKGETGLVEYTNDSDSEYTRHFFQRWSQTQTMLFEFIVIGQQSKPIFCLKGLWSYNQWKFLDVVPTNRLHIIEPSKK